MRMGHLLLNSLLVQKTGSKFIGYENDTIVVENDHKELAIILQGSVMMDEVQVVERKIGVVKSRSSVLNQDMISSAELARAACCNLGESFTTNPSVDVSYADAATGARQIKLLGSRELMYKC